MRVAFHHTAFGAMGGAEVLALTQARLLQEAGWEISIVCFGFDESRWRGLLGASPVTVLPRRHWRDLLAFGDATKWAPRARRAHPHLRGFDAVVAQGNPLAALMGHGRVPGRTLWYCHEPPWRRFPEKVDYTLLQHLPSEGEEAWLGPLRALRDSVLEEARGDARLRALEYGGTRALAGLAANSDFGRRALEACFDRMDVAVIPPLVRFPGESAPKAGLRRGGLQILTLARLESLKNVEGVLRGFAQHFRKSPGARLHVVGDGRERARLAQLAREWGAAEAVTFHGFLDPMADGDRLEALYRACDVFALLPLDESFGLVYPEAAARGLLLVGPDHGGPLEILEGGALGACLPVFDPIALAEAFAALEAMPDAEVDRRRATADAACRSRYGAAAVRPLLQAWIAGWG